MSCKSRFLLVVWLWAGVLAGSAQAGMPRSISLTDVARLRLQSISFFLFVFLLSAWAVQLLWNWLQKDFTFLPRLGYFKALGLTGLWGLLFMLVLTMISGARELLTPGAWQKQGWTYRLADQPKPREITLPLDEQQRHEQMERLRFALWDHARKHQGQFPASETTAEIPAERWLLPDGSGLRYVYRGGTAKKEETGPLAWEPESMGEQRLVLFRDGSIRLLYRKEIDRLLEKARP